MEFPSRLKKLRIQHKLTQEKLGAKVNVTKVSISGYENGNRSPDIDTLQKLAEALDTNVDYLLGRTNDPSPTTSYTVAGQSIQLSAEEARVFAEMRKHPKFNIMFHDLASNPEKKVKMLIKMWETILASLDEDAKDRGDGFGDLADD